MDPLIKNVLSAFLPENTLDYFDPLDIERTDTTMKISLTEKNNPPTDKKVRFKDFQNITITDFPIRGRETTVTYRRRRWVDVDGKTIKRDIPLTASGTKLEKEFALFLKEES